MNDFADLPRVLEGQHPVRRLAIPAPDKSGPIMMPPLEHAARPTGAVCVFAVLALVVVLVVLLAFAVGRAVTR
jgi:hypothetical protein